MDKFSQNMHRIMEITQKCIHFCSFLLFQHIFPHFPPFFPFPYLPPFCPYFSFLLISAHCYLISPNLFSCYHSPRTKLMKWFRLRLTISFNSIVRLSSYATQIYATLSVQSIYFYIKSMRISRK